MESKTKHRLGLIRTLLDYLDHYENDPCETIILANGVPAVELSFRFAAGFQTHDGEDWLLCGHLDKLVSFGGEEWVKDVKTTDHALTPYWFKGFTPDNQFSLYNLAGQIILERPLAGLLLDGVKVPSGSSPAEFARTPVPRPKEVVWEWHAESLSWLRAMEACAEEGVWPANDKSCSMYGGCEFRETCSRAPKARAQWLAATMQRRTWDPLVPR